MLVMLILLSFPGAEKQPVSKRRRFSSDAYVRARRRTSTNVGSASVSTTMPEANAADVRRNTAFLISISVAPWKFTGGSAPEVVRGF